MRQKLYVKIGARVKFHTDYGTVVEHDMAFNNRVHWETRGSGRLGPVSDWYPTHALSALDGPLGPGHLTAIRGERIPHAVSHKDIEKALARASLRLEKIENTPRNLGARPAGALARELVIAGAQMPTVDLSALPHLRRALARGAGPRWDLFVCQWLGLVFGVLLAGALLKGMGWL